MDFEALIIEARKFLDANETDRLATVLFTDKGNTYIIHHKSCEESYAVCATLSSMIAAEDIRILKTVTMFSGGCLEIPSAWLRKFLYELNNDNKDMEILMQDGKRIFLLKDFMR